MIELGIIMAVIVIMVRNYFTIQNIHSEKIWFFSEIMAWLILLIILFRN